MHYKITLHASDIILSYLHSPRKHKAYPIARWTGPHTATAERGELLKDKLSHSKRTFLRYGANRARHLSATASGTYDPWHKVNQSAGKGLKLTYNDLILSSSHHCLLIQLSENEKLVGSLTIFTTHRAWRLILRKTTIQ